MSLVDDDERDVALLRDEIVRERHAMQAAIGDRPFRQSKKTEREQAKESGVLWNAPAQVWAAMLDQKGDKAVREYVDRMTRLRARYPEEANYVPEVPDGAA